MAELNNELAVEKFKEILRFPTISLLGAKNGCYRNCVQWLKNFVEYEIPGIKTQILELVDNKPILLATLPGKDVTSHTSILLNSHYDVVPVEESKWSVKPFEGIETEGRIYGRGAQDMKSVCVQYILALGRLVKKTPHKLEYTVHLSFVPDEEIGGADGLLALINSKHFKDLGSIEMALDEGMASTDDIFTVFYGERTPLVVRVTANGNTGHTSRFIEDTAVEKLTEVFNKALAFRKTEKQKLGYGNHNGCSHAVAKKLGDVTTLNINRIHAGVSPDNGESYVYNVVPSEAFAIFNIRVAPSMPINEMKGLLDKWTEENGLTWNFVHGDPGERHYLSSIKEDDKNNPWWIKFKKACKKANIKIRPEVFPAATDSRHLRKIGIPAFGFSPINNSEIKLHEHDEYLKKDVFLQGIDIYEQILEELLTKR